VERIVPIDHAGEPGHTTTALAVQSNDMIGVDGSNEFASGEDFYGYRHATRDEVVTLIMNHGFANLDSGPSVADNPHFGTFVALLGLTHVNSDGTGYTYGFAQDLDGGTVTPYLVVDQNCCLASTGDIYTTVSTTGQASVTETEQRQGHWLVQGAPPTIGIPEPTTLAIFAFGLACLGFFARRKQTA
jgi:hypothetical protein